MLGLHSSVADKSCVDLGLVVVFFLLIFMMVFLLSEPWLVEDR